MSSAATFSFACQCGARLQARPDMAGKKGKCKFCGQTFVIPAPSATPPPKSKAPASEIASAPLPPEPVRERVCSICQTAVGADEAAAQCDSCGLPFHVECWQANLGCATYGCRNVNCLKPGPDIAIGQAAVTQAQPHGWQTPGGLPRAAAPAKPDIPWEYILLAGSAVAGLLSCVMCGLPSLLVAFAAGAYMSHYPNYNRQVLMAVWIIIGITTVLGMMSSALLMLAG